MSICLSHTSAVSVLQKMASKDRELEPAASSVSVGFEPDLKLAKEALEKYGDTTDAPELLVCNPRHQRASKNAAVHLWTSRLPEGSFYRLEEGVYVASAEFTLLQQANELHPVRLCQLLGRFMGAYKTKVQKGGKVEQKIERTLTTEEGVLRYLANAKGAKGIRPLRDATRWTAPNAASPQETNLQLVMTLPYMFYGFGLPRPIMNYEVELDGWGRGITGKQRCYIDVCWPGKWMGLEYQGVDHGSQLGEDYARFYALEEQGYKIIYVAKEQLRSADQMLYIAAKVARRFELKPDRVGLPDRAGLQTLLDMLTYAPGFTEVERARQRPRGRHVSRTV